jgi:hypothetical protein
MPFIPPFVWETVLKQRGWSVADCAHCQGLEAVRVEEKLFVLSIYLFPIFQDSKGWVGRCDFCGRPVEASTTSQSIGLDEWSPQQRLAPLLRKLGFTGKVRVRRAPVDERLKSFLAATQDATLIKNLNVLLGRGIGFLIGVVLAIPLALVLAYWVRISEDSVGFFVSFSCVVVGVIGAIAGGIIHAMLKRVREAKYIIKRNCIDYDVDIQRLSELSLDYNHVVQRAVAEVHAERDM